MPDPNVDLATRYVWRVLTEHGLLVPAQPVGYNKETPDASYGWRTVETEEDSVKELKRYHEECLNSGHICPPMVLIKEYYFVEHLEELF